ncbi:unnamed protein product [Rotaria sp. Silwood1]|nr:unnamed protein product [Rotaria sp. Silwood1]
MLRRCLLAKTFSSIDDLNATQIHDELIAAYGQGVVVSYSTVAHWFDRFSSGRESLEDNLRNGRPIIIITKQNIDAIQDLVNDDPHISIGEKTSSKTSSLSLHYKIAKLHIQDIVLNLYYLQEEKMKAMAHLAYSSDCAPSDFWLFSCLKRSLDTYPDATSLAKAITNELNSISIQKY